MTEKIGDIERAKRYMEYLQGWAYIPLQDLPIYERAYKEHFNVIN